MRAFIVDDEALAVKRLTRMLEETGRVEVAGSATDPEDALAFLRTHAVDVLFLDIQMPALTGFELLERLDAPPLVVFTTAYDAHALRAFEVNSIDYLLKPIGEDRLARALDKAERMNGRQSSVVGRQSQSSDIRTLAKQLAAELAPQRRLERIASRVGEKTTILDVARVTHFFSKDKLTFAATGGRDHVVDYTLSQLEQQLDPRRFARIHRATIVNVPMVQELFPDVDGGVVVRLKDERKTELSVARDRVRELKERLGI
ncbi:MAG TPA: LytTR family DNA-binding domain-containing protein [Vicinamibacterales bacterium]|nr:LytTR family DNA-binding domain-containing protein [Vicinamibacterales bacterium]